METLFVPNEDDFKRWIREAVMEYFQEFKTLNENNLQAEERLLNRKEIAQFLRISLVTLTDWIKRGLPSHKQGSRVYFLKSEVLDFIKQKKSIRLKFAGGLKKLSQEVA